MIAISEMNRGVVVCLLLLAVSSCTGFSSRRMKAARVSLSAVSEPDSQHEPDGKEVRLYVSLESSGSDGASYRWVTSSVKSDTDTLLVIDSGSDYSRGFESGRRFDIPLAVEELDWFELVYPVLNVYLVNNSDRTLNVSSLELEVGSSELDRRPFIMMATFEGSRCNEMEIANWGYSKEPYLSLEYRILKKGETFDGTYDRKRVLPGDGGPIDFLDDLVEMGYDFEALKKALPDAVTEDCERDYEEVDGEIANPSVTHREIVIYGEDRQLVDRLFFPFEVSVDPYASDEDTRIDKCLYVFAPLYGRLTCPGSGASFEFRGRICLAQSGDYGAGMDDDDSFDVQLKVQDRGYRIRYPYLATIEPGGSEKVSLRIKCEKSSLHRFWINAVNENGLSLSSREVSMRYFAPKYSYGIPRYDDYFDSDEQED